MTGEISQRQRVFESFDEDGQARNILSLRTGENATLAFDMSPTLNPDDALSATADITQLGGNELTIASVTIRHNRVNANITAGLESDKSYTVQCQATTSEGDVLERTGVVHGV